MYTIHADNVNDAYFRLTAMLRREDDSTEMHRRPSRYGDVIEFADPVATVYRKPWECVLLDLGRNINPFFHFMEALWILAGRNDVEFVARYASKMREFSDDGTTFHGAYGDRWRWHFQNGEYADEAKDQLETCIRALQHDQDDRRCVLAMWDPSVDLGRKGKDFPCNTHIYLKVRQGKVIATVCCRSNDMLWGCYGTNATQFGFLIAYVAARLGLPIGDLTTVSDSAHVYTKVWDATPPAEFLHTYPGTLPLCDDPESFIAECEDFCNEALSPATCKNKFFVHTASPMRGAWVNWKAGETAHALVWANRIAAPDWREACVAWLQRAAIKRENKESTR